MIIFSQLCLFDQAIARQHSQYYYTQVTTSLKTNKIDSDYTGKTRPVVLFFANLSQK